MTPVRQTGGPGSIPGGGQVVFLYSINFCSCFRSCSCSCSKKYSSPVFQCSSVPVCSMCRCSGAEVPVHKSVPVFLCQRFQCSSVPVCSMCQCSKVRGLCAQECSWVPVFQCS